jgi:hypothetical protein
MRGHAAGLRPAAAAIALACAIALAGCGNTLQDQQVSHSALETLLVSPFPVYWVGGTFHGLAITETSHDPSGGVSLQYGDCVIGGQGTCVSSLRIVTSPDNGFLPLGSALTTQTEIRGIPVQLAQRGETIVVPTGPVVVTIYAQDRALARTAASAMVAINEPAALGAPLPAAQANTGFGETALPSQEPPPLRPIR